MQTGPALTDCAHSRGRRSEGILIYALRLLITRVPDHVSVRVITAVCVTLTMFGFVIFGVLTDTELGPHLQQIITVSIAVPVIVVMPFASVAIGLVREYDAERIDAMALAAIDPLTGLHNRRRFLELFERDLTLLRRMRRPMLIALIDIDDFKSVNDVHGHNVGDLLLRAIAAACLRCVRTSDTVGRWGGEEFVLLLPDTESAGGKVLLERMRTEIAATFVPDGTGRPLARTISIGAIVLSPPAAGQPVPTAQALLDDADRAMYRAKVGGKDRVVIECPRASGADRDLH
jgi:diguanylate cyclase (GGDEF)-like protein